MRPQTPAHAFTFHRPVPLSLLLAFSLVVGSALFFATPSSPCEAGAEGDTRAMVQPEYDEKGMLKRPEGYERWTFVGTSLGLSYSEGPEEEGPGVFHNVYVQPAAFDYFAKRGEFPEKTIFVMTNSPATKKAGEPAIINRKGHFAGATRGLEVAVKDGSRFEEGWAYFLFRSAAGPRSSARAFPREQCWDCHAEHAQDDNVFTQFYSVLEAVRPKKGEPKNP